MCTETCYCEHTQYVSRAKELHVLLMEGFSGESDAPRFLE